MLRITVLAGEPERRLIVEGKLAPGGAVLAFRRGAGTRFLIRPAAYLRLFASR